MGKSLSLTKADNEKLIELKKKLNASSKIEVLRMALDLIAKKLDRDERVERWRNATEIVEDSSVEVLNDFQTQGRFNKLP